MPADPGRAGLRGEGPASARARAAGGVAASAVAARWSPNTHRAAWRCPRPRRRRRRSSPGCRTRWPSPAPSAPPCCASSLAPLSGTSSGNSAPVARRKSHFTLFSIIDAKARDVPDPRENIVSRLCERFNRGGHFFSEPRLN